ncbi:PhoQ sensor [Fragilaria crotonensis]|nr:PhoQ sensor [Fragilaria crotonensis]
MLAMMEQRKCKEVECATLVFSTLSRHSQESINGLLESFDHAMNVGLVSGDVAWDFYSLSVCVQSRRMIRENLAVVEEFQREQYLRAAQRGHVLGRLSEPSMQYVLNLQRSACNWRELLTLNGEVMDEDEYYKFACQGSNDLPMLTLSFFKMQLAYHFGVYHVAERFLFNLDRVGLSALTHFTVPLWNYLAASIHYELYIRFPSEQRAHLKAARKYRKVLTRTGFSPDSIPFLMLLTAEEMSSKGKATPEQVVASYYRAIAAMAATGWANMEGLANEKVGFYLARVGDLDRASAFFDRAMHLYRYEWGALAKYEWLLEQSELAMGRRGGWQCPLPREIVGRHICCSP